MTDEGMTAYTKWWLAHPWHVTKGMPVPPDCDCETCVEKRAKKEMTAYLESELHKNCYGGGGREQ